jgi:mannose/fructose-specific phosphotransferase system component IIA
MTGIVLVTHAGLGESLRHQAEVILGRMMPMTTVSVSEAADLDEALASVTTALAMGADPAGAIVLTDLPGATPHNLACRAAAPLTIPVVSGLNLPMLLKVLNHADKSPAELAHLACAGGQQAIFAS